MKPMEQKTAADHILFFRRALPVNAFISNLNRQFV